MCTHIMRIRIDIFNLICIVLNVRFFHKLKYRLKQLSKLKITTHDLNMVLLIAHILSGSKVTLA